MTVRVLTSVVPATQSNRTDQRTWVSSRTILPPDWYPDHPYHRVSPYELCNNQPDNKVTLATITQRSTNEEAKRLRLAT